MSMSRCALWLLASPVAAAAATGRLARQLWRARMAARPCIPCRTCGEAISLYGFWRCRCGFTYQGHLLRYCPVCGSFPRLIRCYACGATEAVRQ